MTKLTCRIQWVDKDGRATPDQLPAVGYVYRAAHTEYFRGREIRVEESNRFPICACHLEELNKPEMVHWRFIPLMEVQTEASSAAAAG